VSASQVPATPPAADVEQMVARFVETAEQYQRTFRNLTAEETTLHEAFHQDGRLRRRREVTADLLVYLSARAADDPVEYRDVKSVDGKAVGGRDRRALDLVTRAANAGSVERELQIISRESRRYDFDHHVGGFTMNQFVSTMRDDLRFDWAGREQVDGHDTLGVTYREIVPKPEYSGITRHYRGMGVTSFFVRGRLWLDADRFQLRRSRFEVAGVHPGLPEPTTIMSIDHTYTESRFGILVPSRIVFEWFERSGSKAKPAFTLTARTTFTYGTFREFAVATQETVATPK
jgi:hypothetical protein